MTLSVLVVDADEAQIDSVEAALRNVQLEPLTALDAVTAAKIFDEYAPVVVLIGVREQGLDAKALTQNIRAKSKDVPILFMGYGMPTDAIRAPSEAIDAGGDYYFRLPTDLAYLAGRVRGWAQTGVSMVSSIPVEIKGPSKIDELSTQSPRGPLTAVQSPVATARALVREAELLRQDGRVDDAIETYQAAAAIYAHHGEVRPALALHKLLVYIDSSRVELAHKGAVFAARHGEHADARSMIERTIETLEKTGRAAEAIELLRRFTEDAGPDPKLTSVRHRLEATYSPSQQRSAPEDDEDADAIWSEMIDEAVAAQEDMLKAIPEPGPEAAEIHPWSDSLDLIGSQPRVSDDLYPDTTELMHPSTYDLRGPVMEASRTSAETHFEDPVEAFTAELEAIERASAVEYPEPTEERPQTISPTNRLDSSTCFNPEDTVRRTRRPRLDSGVFDPNSGIFDPSNAVSPMVVERERPVSTFDFPSVDQDTPQSDDILQMVIDPEGAPTELHDGDEEPFDTKTEEVDISLIPAMAELQAQSLETVEIPLQNGGSLGIDSLALPPPQWSSPSKEPPTPVDNRGKVYELRDCIDLLGELHATGASGVLTCPAVQLVLAYGQPAAISGDRAIRDLIGRAHHGRPVPLEALPDDVEVASTPVALAQHLVTQGVMSEAESTAVLHNQLERGLRAWLSHRGEWTFETTKAPREGLIPGLPDIRATLIDLLDDPEVESPLDPQLIVQGGAADLSVLIGRDRRFAALLDGHRPLV
ncbi:MAG: hypothetical protein AAF449_09375, partial [Myxococcota bacterium]